MKITKFRHNARVNFTMSSIVPSPQLGKNGRHRFYISNFPFDKLRIIPAKQLKESAFGDIHQPTKLEIIPGVLEDYEIEFPIMKSTSIIYWIDAKENNIMNPSLYVHPDVFSKWPEKNKTGLEIDKFLKDFKRCYANQLNKFTKDEKEHIMGEELANREEDTFKSIKDIANPQKFPKDHKISPNKIDDSKSTSFPVSIWTEDIVKREERRKKSPQSNKFKKQYENDDFMIPNTNTAIYTDFYNMVKKNSYDAIKNKVKDYDIIRKYIYSSQPRRNTNSSMCDLMIKIVVLNPFGLWKPKDNLKGVIQLKSCELHITGCNERKYNNSLSYEKISSINMEHQLLSEEYGFVQESDDEDEEEDKLMKSSIKRKRDGDSDINENDIKKQRIDCNDDSI